MTPLFRWYIGISFSSVLSRCSLISRQDSMLKHFAKEEHGDKTVQVNMRILPVKNLHFSKMALLEFCRSEGGFLFDVDYPFMCVVDIKIDIKNKIKQIRVKSNARIEHAIHIVKKEKTDILKW